MSKIVFHIYREMLKYQISIRDGHTTFPGSQYYFVGSVPFNPRAYPHDQIYIKYGVKNG